METNRANITLLVKELLDEGLVREGSQGNQNIRGRRRPSYTLIPKRRSGRGDVRASRTFLMITDSIGKQIGEIVSFPTRFDPEEFVASFGWQVRKALKEQAGITSCDGIGIVVPEWWIEVLAS
jgi:hypothetical protein